MKRFSGVVISLLLAMAIAAHAINPEEQAELLLTKISTALKKDRTSEALSACAKLEKLGPSLAKPLPESFYFYYIETLQRSGAKELVLSRAYAYQQQFGKTGAHYAQVTAIVSQIEKEAMAAGGADADAAVSDREEALRRQGEKEHEQTLALLRSCQGEAIALEGGEKELESAFAAINAQSAALLSRKAELDQRVLIIDNSGQKSAQEQRQMRIDFNRDSQAYNDAISDFTRAREEYDTKAEGQGGRFQRYKERCTNLTILQSELEEFCGRSADWFCHGNE